MLQFEGIDALLGNSGRLWDCGWIGEGQAHNVTGVMVLVSGLAYREYTVPLAVCA